MTTDPATPKAVLIPRWLFRVLGTTLLLLLVSLAYYSQTNTGWMARGEYDIDVKHTALGLPPWLVINRWEVRGTPPPLDQLPDGGVYQQGWYVQPQRLFFAALFCAGMAMLLLWVASRIPAPSSYRPYAVALILAAVIGAIVPTGATVLSWMRPALLLGFLPVVLVAAAAIGRNYWYASAMGIAAMILLWASSRIADVFGARFLYGPPGVDDLMAASLFIPAALITVLAATFFSRSMAVRAGHNFSMASEVK
jgi:hypothetical protein